MYWEDKGPTNAPPVLLLEGYTGQLIGWRDAFCDLLVDEGLRVIRMDNRDIGLSRHEPPGSRYTLADMATDVVDVLDHAEIAQATIVGQSMGGMIAQHVALDYPERVASLVLLYTTPTIRILSRDSLQPEHRTPRNREEAIEIFLKGNRPTASPAYPYDEERQKALAGRMYDRDSDHSGIARQREAVSAMPDLRPRLPHLRVPVTLIHGRADTLIPSAGSLLIAEQLPHAELHLYPGMGHEVPEELWSEIVRAIVRTTRHQATSPRQPTPAS